MTLRAHAAAVSTLLGTASGLVVHDGEIPLEPASRYVVFYLSTSQGVDRSRRLSTDYPKLRFLLSTLCVGATPNEVRWVIEKVHTALIGNRLAVTGRTCDPFTPPSTPGQVRPDDSTAPPAWVATDVWAFNSSRTA